MSSNPSDLSSVTEPAWEVAELFPAQGDWTDSDFFRLDSNRMVELVDGHLEVLPMPTWMHQLIVKFLVSALDRAIKHLPIEGRGTVLDAPLPIRLSANSIREPDVMYFAPGSEPKDLRSYPSRADLVMEVVSEGTKARKRDYEDKRRDYANAGIQEYWIVDPDDGKVTVLSLNGGTYSEHGVFAAGQTAQGRYLPELSVEIDALIAITKGELK